MTTASGFPLTTRTLNQNPQEIEHVHSRTLETVQKKNSRPFVEQGPEV